MGLTSEFPSDGKRVSAEAQAAFDAQRREVNREILERAEADPEFGKQLAENPKAAIEGAGLGEKMDVLTNPHSGSDVSGHGQSDVWEVCYGNSSYVEWYHEG